MPTVKVRFEEGQLAAVDRARGDVPRERWIRRLCMDGVSAVESVPRGAGVVSVVSSPAGRLAPRPVDAEVARLTGHPVQPCRCEACGAAREGLR